MKYIIQRPFFIKHIKKCFPTDEMQNESPKNLYNAIMHQKILE